MTWTTWDDGLGLTVDDGARGLAGSIRSLGPDWAAAEVAIDRHGLPYRRATVAHPSSLRAAWELAIAWGNPA